MDEMISNEQKMNAIAKISLSQNLLIMQIVNQNFEFKTSVNKHICESFVGFYKAFFEVYEESFQFEIRIKSFLRLKKRKLYATQHNIIIGLVKYLILVVTITSKHLCGRAAKNFHPRPA
jgi:hypothetical protein